MKIYCLIVDERSVSQNGSIVECLHPSGRAYGPWRVNLMNSFSGICRWGNGEESGRGVGYESQKNDKHLKIKKITKKNLHCCNNNDNRKWRT